MQGNILASRNVLTATLRAFQAAGKYSSLTLADRLLRALEAGAANGGDRRCGTQTAQSAHLVVVRPGDPPGEPYLYITESDLQPHGRNAVRLLRQRYDKLVLH